MLFCSAHILIIVGIALLLVWGATHQNQIRAQAKANEATIRALGDSYFRITKLVAYRAVSTSNSGSTVRSITACSEAFNAVEAAEAAIAGPTSADIRAYLEKYRAILASAQGTIQQRPDAAGRALSKQLGPLFVLLERARSGAFERQNELRTESAEFGTKLTLGVSLLLLLESFGLFVPLARSWRKTRTALETKANELQEKNSELTEARDSLIASQQVLEEQSAQLQDFVKQQEVHLELLQMGTARFQGLFQNLPAVCFTTDTEGNLFEWNSEAERALGYLGFALFEQSIFDAILPEEGRKQWSDTFEALAKGTTVRFVEHLVRHQSGTVCKMLVSAFGLKGAGGTITSYVFSGIILQDQEESGLELALLKEALEHVSDGVCITDENLIIEFTNSGYTACTGYSTEELVGKHPSEILQGRSTDLKTKASIKAAIKKREPINARILNYSKSGEPYWADLRIVPYQERNGNCTKFLGFHSRVSQEKVLAEELMHRQHIFDAAMNHFKTALILLDATGRITMANQAASDLIGLPSDELEGKRPWSVLPLKGADSSPIRADQNPFVRAIRRGETINGELFALPSAETPDEPRYLRIECVPFEKTQGSHARSVLIFVDEETAEVRQQLSLEQYLMEVAEQSIQMHLESETQGQENSELQIMTRVDELTQTLNRRGFKTDVQKLLASNSPESALVVAMIDVDLFKTINDTYGHATGDLALREVAQRLKGALNADDIVGRLSGDEFAIYCSSMGAEELQTRLGEAFPFVLGLENADHVVTLSVGLVSVCGPATYEWVLAAADEAAYTSKRNGRNRITLRDLELGSGDQAA